MTAMDKKEIDKEIGKFEPGIKKYSDEFWAYRTLFTLPLVGPFKSESDAVEKVERFWKTGKDYVHVQNTQVRRACRNRIVRYGLINNQDQFLDSEIYSDGVGLALGATILLGSIRRIKSSAA